MHTQPAVKKKRKFAFLDNFIFAPILAYLLIGLGHSVGMLVINGMTSLLGLVHPSIPQSDIWQSAQFYLLFIGIWILALAVILIFPGNRPMLKTLGPKMKGNTPKFFLLGLAIGLGMNLVCAFAAMLNGDIALSFAGFNPFFFLLMFVSVFIQSAAEELICRGYLFQKLVRRYRKPWLACLLNAAFFSLVHAMNPGVTPLALLNIFLYGLLFSAMVIYMDSLWAAMAAHAAWNFCQSVLLGLPNSGSVMPYSVFKLDAAAARDSFAYSVGFGLEGTIMACAILAVVFGGILWWGIRGSKKATDIWQTQE